MFPDFRHYCIDPLPGLSSEILTLRYGVYREILSDGTLSAISDITHRLRGYIGYQNAKDLPRGNRRWVQWK
jgi:hypothetical protein